MAKKKSQTRVKSTGRYSYEGLDRVLHEKARLGLVTCLAGEQNGLTFGELKKLCDLTDGNLSRHLKHLSDAGFVRMERDESAGRPLTTCFLTSVGRESFVNYLSELQRVIGDAKSKIELKPTKNARLASE